MSHPDNLARGDISSDLRFNASPITYGFSKRMVTGTRAGSRTKTEIFQTKFSITPQVAAPRYLLYKKACHIY